MQTETRIKIERPSGERLKTLRVASWPIWTKAVSAFDWHYEEPEMCYFLEGEVTVKTDRGEVALRPGDLVSFPQGLSCTWRVIKSVRKHYRFGKIGGVPPETA
jgi:uncharacterized cupin superfamily protein